MPFGRERSGVLFRAAAYEPAPQPLLERVEALMGLQGPGVLRYADRRRGPQDGAEVSRVLHTVEDYTGIHQRPRVGLRRDGDPGQHAAYVGSWIKALQDEPLEVFRAAADAEKIHDYVLAFEQKQVQEQDQQQSQAQDEAVAQALAVDIAEVLDNPDVSFSHYQAFQGDTLEDALRSRGLETVGSITGTDPEQFYAVAHDRLSPVFGIDPSHTDTDNAYLERKGLAQEFANIDRKSVV